LHRLEERGCFAATSATSENNRQAKFYRLSAAGRRQLRSGSSAWHAFVEAASRALRASAPETA